MGKPTVAKIISIDPIDQLEERSVGEVVAEARECLNAFQPCLESLGKAYPGVIAVGAIGAGEVFACLILARSKLYTHVSLGALSQVRDLAIILANLPPSLSHRRDLRLAFKAAYEKEFVKASKLVGDAAAAAEKRSE